MFGEHVTVPGFGSRVVNVEVSTGIGSFLRKLQEFNKAGASKLRYRLKGTALVEAPSNFKLPFDEKGEVDLGLGQADRTGAISHLGGQVPAMSCSQ